MTQRQNSLMAAPRLSLLCALALSIGGAGASALELGGARIVSAPGAPIEIEVALLEVAAGELDTLKPQLPASSRSPSLAVASVEVSRAADGSAVLRVRSPSPTASDDLRFVVVADWGSGRRFREYVISLSNPATGAPAAPADLSAAPAPTSASASSTRLVRANETLMSISREWSATTGVTLPQAMLGIYRANPGAFGPAGMSEMIVGSVLSLPDAQALKKTSPAAASAEVGRVLGIWRTGGATAARQGAPVPGTQTLTTAPPVGTRAPATVVPAPPTLTLTPAPTAVPAAPADVPADVPADAPAVTPDPVIPETPEAKAARLEAEIEALEARLADAQAVSGGAAVDQGGWRGQAQRWASTAWWSIPALLLISLVLGVAFLVRGRRAPPAPDAAPPQEMTFDVPPVRATRDPDPLPDPLMDAPIRPVATPPPPVGAAEEDLEGDPPPIDEASSKINLARAFIEMGQHDAAILELQAALRLGDETQRAEAIRLLDSLPKS